MILIFLLHPLTSEPENDYAEMEKLRKKLSEKLVVKSSHPPAPPITPPIMAAPIAAAPVVAEPIAEPLIPKKTPDQVLHACIVKTSLEQTKKCFRCSSVS